MVRLKVSLHLKTGNVLKVSRDGDESKATWLAQSAVTFRELGTGWIILTMDEAQAAFAFGEPLPLVGRT